MLCVGVHGVRLAMRRAAQEGGALTLEAGGVLLSRAAGFGERVAGPPLAPRQAGPPAAALLTPSRQIFGIPGTIAPQNNEFEDQRLFGWSPDKVFDVVADVSKYEEFVPWCVGSHVTRQVSEKEMEAELEVGFQIFSERYTSLVKMSKPTFVHASVPESKLFDHLDHRWNLLPGPTKNSTDLSFFISFAFRSPLHSQVAGLFLTEVAGRTMNAFEDRCALLYGPSSLDA